MKKNFYKMEKSEKEYWIDYFSYFFVTTSLMKMKGKGKDYEKTMRALITRALELEDYETASCIEQSIKRIKTGLTNEKNR